MRNKLLYTLEKMFWVRYLSSYAVLESLDLCYKSFRAVKVFQNHPM